MSEIKSRLLLFLKEIGKGQTKFEEEVGLSRGAITNIKDGLSSKSINKISEKYPEFNTSWLLTGEGNMLKETPISQIISDGSVVVPREVFEHITKMIQTMESQQKLMESQQKTIEALTETNKKIAVQVG